MSYEAKVFRVLIASPSDVTEEREITVKAIQEWNDLNSPERRIVLLPLRWETHSAPEYGTRPQEVINRQVVDHCDLVIGIFWTRIGSPTGVADSGTLEEIERVAGQGKPVMLYFSQVKKDPSLIEIDQLAKLRDFREKTFPKALVESFGSQIEFRDKLTKQLEIQLRSLVASEAKVDGDAVRPNNGITLEFCNPQDGNSMGQSIKISTTYLNVQGIDDIQDYASIPSQAHNEGISNVSRYLLERENRDYYREYVEFFVKSALLRPVSFALKNNGVLGARDIFLDMRITTDIADLTVSSNLKLKVKKPEKNRDNDYSLSLDEAFSGIGGETLSIEQQSGAWIANIETRALQPKRIVRSKYKMIVGAKTSGSIDIEAKIYADILPEPLIQRLHIDMEVTELSPMAIDLLRENGVIEEPKNARRRRKISGGLLGDESK